MQTFFVCGLTAQLVHISAALDSTSKMLNLVRAIVEFFRGRDGPNLNVLVGAGRKSRRSDAWLHVFIRDFRWR